MYKTLIFGITMSILVTPRLLFSQGATKNRLSGTYYGSTGGQSPHSKVEREELVCLNPPKCDSMVSRKTVMHVMGEFTPIARYKLRLKSGGRFIYKEKEPNVRYYSQFFFIKTKRKWLTLRGHWTLENDSVYLENINFKGEQKAFYCKFHESYKNRFGLTNYYYYLVGRRKVFGPFRN